jgi:cytochrome c oxidase cbb3-type subunit 3
MSLPRVAITALAVAVGVVAWECGSTRGPGTAHQAGTADSSFAAVTFSHGRTPVELSMVTGKVVFDRYCAICHGESGGGDGFNAYNVKAAYGVDPTAFSDSARMVSLADAQALKAIREGGGAVGKSAAMPGWGRTLSPGELADVWRYARSLAATTHAP